MSGILWHNDATNETQIWFLQGRKVIDSRIVVGEDGNPALVGGAWGIVGVGDLGGGEGGDIVWHNSETNETQIWFMHANNVVRRGTVLGEDGNAAFVGLPFSIVGVGKGEIVWHHSDTNETQIWFMDKENLVGRGTVLGEDGNPAFIGPPFTIVGVGDLGGGGSADFVWHHSDTHETQIWFMNENNLVSRGTVLGEDGNPAFVGPPWSIVGVGDLVGTASADILWHNADTNETQIWSMNENTVVGRGTVVGADGNPALVGPPWRIVAVTGAGAGVLSPVKRAVISLDRLHCHKRGEISEAEPYLLVAFFKVDGDSNSIGVRRNDETGELEGFVDGSCTFQGTAGTHGNLGDTSVDDGDDVSIPPALGQFEADLKPITGADLMPSLPEVGIGGFAGVVVALLEENSLTDSAAAAGHAAFDRTLEREINETVRNLRQGTDEPLPPAEIERLKNEVADRVKAAVIDAEGNFFRLLNADTPIGADVFFANTSRDIHARLQRVITVHQSPPFGDQQVLTHDYELFGSIAVDIPLV